MNLLALKFVAAGMIAVGLMFLSMAIGAGWVFVARRANSARGGPRERLGGL